jgi:hypothetical protein
VKPRELRIVHDEAEEFAGGDDAVDSLVVAAFHVQQSLVQTEMCLSQRDKFLAGRGVAPVALIGVRISGLSQDICSLTILRQIATAG